MQIIPRDYIRLKLIKLLNFTLNIWYLENIVETEDDVEIEIYLDRLKLMLLLFYVISGFKIFDCRL